ncbi:Uncharacterised protein [Mycobacteroides abscessus subsp. abscessus]|nr:Uncharacterised protein [Mycobacteroides abscessus subsp. abscessus]
MTTFERAAHELRSLDVAAWPAMKCPMMCWPPKNTCRRGCVRVPQKAAYRSSSPS